MRKLGVFLCFQSYSLMVLLFGAFLSLAVFAQEAKTKAASSAPKRTVLTVLPFEKSPVIDGQIAPAEWEDAVMHWGGVSTGTEMLAQRRVDFRIGFDAEALYLAQASELPPADMKEIDSGQVSIVLLPPGRQPFLFSFDSQGKPIPENPALPSSAVFAEKKENKSWTWELKLPFAAIGATVDKTPWGIQMSHSWSNPTETAYLHLPSKAFPMAELHFAQEGATVFMVEFQEKGTSYPITWQFRNASKKETTLMLTGGIVSLEAPIIFDTKVILQPGERKNIKLHKILQLDVFRDFSLRCQDEQGTVVLERSFAWDSRKVLSWKNPNPPYKLHFAMRPTSKSFRVRLFCASRERLKAVPSVLVRVRDDAGKTFLERQLERRSNDDFFLEWTEPQMASWPRGKYYLDAIFKNDKGAEQTLTHTFGLYEFEWENNKLGKSELIVPPFRPLQENGSEITALLTGYRRSKVFWDAIYAQGENILAAPIELLLDGKPFTVVDTRKIPAGFGMLGYESELQCGALRLVVRQIYDYDGMCKVTLSFKPEQELSLKDLHFDIRMKREFARFYHATGARLRNDFHGEIKVQEGPVWNSLKGRVIHPSLTGWRPYIWFGGSYKGIAWFAETPLHWSLDPEQPAQTLTVEKDAAVLRVRLVDRPVTWKEPFDIVMGFQPTPVKPQPPLNALPGIVNREYNPQKFSRYLHWIATYTYLGLRYEEGLLQAPPNNDWSFLEYMTASQWKTPKEAQVFAQQWIAKNGLNNDDFSKYGYRKQSHMDAQLRSGCETWRKSNSHTIYQNPRALPPSREYDMYVDEWTLWETRTPEPTMSHFGFDPDDKYADYMLWNNKQMFRFGFRGIYYDNLFETLCYNPAKGPAIEVEPGKILPFYPFFAMRELLKRTAVMLTEEGHLLAGYPMLETHISDTNMVPFGSFNATTLDWEFNYGSDPYPQRFSQAYIQTNTTSSQIGALGRNILQFAAADEKVERSALAVLFANNLMSFYLHTPAGLKLDPFFYKARDTVFEFGYDREDTVVYPGWNDDNPVKVSPQNVKATAVKRADGEVLLMVGNIGEAANATLSMGDFASGTIIDAMTDEKLGEGNSIAFPVGKQDFRLLRVVKRK